MRNLENLNFFENLEIFENLKFSEVFEIFKLLDFRIFEVFENLKLLIFLKRPCGYKFAHMLYSFSGCVLGSIVKF